MWMWLSIFLPAATATATDTCTEGACAAQSAALLQSSMGPRPHVILQEDYRRITPCQDSSAFTPDKDGMRGGRNSWEISKKSSALRTGEGECLWLKSYHTKRMQNVDFERHLYLLAYPLVNVYIAMENHYSIFNG